MEKIAVTGATGFIGQHLVCALLKRGNIVYPIGRDFRPVECDVIYHLACPSTTAFINAHPTEVMDIILDGTRQALAIDPKARFVNASSMGVKDLDYSPQGAYNIAKLCAEHYISHKRPGYLNYRLPSVYGPGMPNDAFIKRCVDGTARVPTEPNKIHYIAHVDDVVDAFLNYTELSVEKITVGEIYESFSSGRRGIHRTTSDASLATRSTD